MQEEIPGAGAPSPSEPPPSTPAAPSPWRKLRHAATHTLTQHRVRRVCRLLNCCFLSFSFCNWSFHSLPSPHRVPQAASSFAALQLPCRRAHGEPGAAFLQWSQKQQSPYQKILRFSP